MTNVWENIRMFCYLRNFTMRFKKQSMPALNLTPCTVHTFLNVCESQCPPVGGKRCLFSFVSSLSLSTSDRMEEKAQIATESRQKGDRLCFPRTVPSLALTVPWRRKSLNPMHQDGCSLCLGSWHPGQALRD